MRLKKNVYTKAAISRESFFVCTRGMGDAKDHPSSLDVKHSDKIVYKVRHQNPDKFEFSASFDFEQVKK